LLRLSTVVVDSSPDYVVEDPPVAPFGLAFETDERERVARFDTVRKSLDRGRRILVGFETVAIARFEVRLVPCGVVCLFVAEPLYLEGLLALFRLRDGPGYETVSG
jgi:hypothetical protein